MFCNLLIDYQSNSTKSINQPFDDVVVEAVSAFDEKNQRASFDDDRQNAVRRTFHACDARPIDRLNVN